MLGKVNVKLSLCLTNQALRLEGVWGSGCVDPHFFDLGTSWRRVVRFMPRPLYPRGKNPLYPLDRKLGGPQNLSGRRGGEKILDPSQDSNFDSSVIQPVASGYTDRDIPAHSIYGKRQEEQEILARCLYMCLSTERCSHGLGDVIEVIPEPIRWYDG
jgi:hypothetical protein